MRVKTTVTIENAECVEDVEIKETKGHSSAYIYVNKKHIGKKAKLVILKGVISETNIG